MKDGESTDETDDAGKKDNPDVPVVEDNKVADKPDNNSSGENPLDRAERINKEKSTNLDREEKILERKEKLLAEERVGGRATIGSPTPEKDPKEKAKDYGKSIMAGKLPEKEDGK